MVNKAVGIVALIFFVCIFSNTAGASISPIILDAGLIEFEGDYVRASEGFEFQYEGKVITGINMSYNLNSLEYKLDQVAFTACIKPTPHYVIYAKHLEIYPEERIVFRNARVKVGSLVIPFIFRFELIYQDGIYTFPQWLPELFYSSDGLGIRHSYTFNPLSFLRLGYTLAVNFNGKVGFQTWGQYDFSKDAYLYSKLEYDKIWFGYGEIQWRKNKLGSKGFVIYDVDENGEDTLQAYLGYAWKSWSLGYKFKESIPTSFKSTFEVKSSKMNFWHVKHDFSLGMTRFNDTKVDLNYEKLYVSNHLWDQYALSGLNLSWDWKMTHIFTEYLGWSGQGLGSVGITLPIAKNWSTHLGYSKSMHWGTLANINIDEYEKKEQVKFQIKYKHRNQFAEGWDFTLHGQYDLLNSKFSEGSIKVVKAFDCFDVVTDLKLIDFELSTKIMLKF